MASRGLGLVVERSVCGLAGNRVGPLRERVVAEPLLDGFVSTAKLSGWLGRLLIVPADIHSSARSLVWFDE